MNLFDQKISEIKSRDNQKLKFGRAVRDGRERDKMFVEGLRLCEEILKTENKINSVFFTAKFKNSQRGFELLEHLVKKDSQLFEVEEGIFDSLSDTKQSQGVVIIAEKPPTGKEIVEKIFKTSDIKNPFFYCFIN